MAVRRVVVAEHRERADHFDARRIHRHQHHGLLLVGRRIRIGAAHHDQDFRAAVGRAGGPPFAAVDDVAVAVAPDLGADIGGVRRRDVRLGHRETGPDLAVHQWRQPALLPEACGDRVGRLGGAPADVDAVVLDDSLVDIARVLLRGSERLSVQSAGRDGENDESDYGVHPHSLDAGRTRPDAPHLEPRVTPGASLRPSSRASPTRRCYTDALPSQRIRPRAAGAPHELGPHHCRAALASSPRAADSNGHRRVGLGGGVSRRQDEAGRSPGGRPEGRGAGGGSDQHARADDASVHAHARGVRHSHRGRGRPVRPHAHGRGAAVRCAGRGVAHADGLLRADVHAQPGKRCRTRWPRA